MGATFTQTDLLSLVQTVLWKKSTESSKAGDGEAGRSSQEPTWREGLLKIDPPKQARPHVSSNFSLRSAKLDWGNLTGLITWFHQPNVAMKEKRDGKRVHRLKYRQHVYE